MAENPRIEELRRRVQADPASIAFAALAEEFRRVGRHEEAVETCRTGLQRHPAYLSARVTLGRALIETGDFDGAREELETVLRTAPENLAAIRGLAQIHERLGHSTEMDPHLADMMKAMHAESIRVAAERKPEPPPPISEPVEPEAALAAEPEPEIELSMAPPPPMEPALSLAPDLTPAPPASTPEPPAPEIASDPFAAFAPISQPAAAPDFTFDLSAAIRRDPPRDPAADVRFDLAQDTSLDLSMSPVEPAGDAGDAGPDPDTLATLARLERFLGAIQSLRT